MSYMDRFTKNVKSNKHGHVSEKHAMKALGAKQTPGSGALVSAKSDGHDEQFQYENKATTKKSFSIKKDILKKIDKEALDVGRYPVLCVSFTDGTGRSLAEGDFVVITRDLFDSLRKGDLV